MSGEEAHRRSLWRFGENMNINTLQNRVRDNAIQRHVGQVVRGVIPGARPQPEYHPNPYLQHVYNNQEAGTTNRVEANGGNGQQGLDFVDIEAQLQEILTQSDDTIDGDNESNHEHTHAHGHTHDQRQRVPLDPLDWKVILSSLSFVIILFLRLMADHILGLLVFIGLSTVFYYSNLKMIEIVHVTSLRERQNRLRVFLASCWVIVFLCANIACIYWFFEDQKLWRVLYFHLPSSWQGDLFDLLWVTMVTDHIIRFGGIILKSVISMMPQLILLQKKKGKYYMFIETMLQVYRNSLPIIPWVHFLYDQPRSGKLIFAAILVVVYIILKGWGFSVEFNKVKKAVQTLRTDTPTAEEIKSREEHCPICQEDYQDPIMLSCKHIFCENCVSIWFDREKTCPMCRAEIKAESPVWQDGSTSAHLQWY